MVDQSIPTINHYIALIETDSFDTSVSFVENLAQDIINDLDLTVVKKITHLFSPSGITLAYLLSQSHLIIHTWPESGIIHIDLVVCSDCSKNEFQNSLRYALSECGVHSTEIRSVNFDKL